MRIIGGAHRGRRLVTPQPPQRGDTPVTRPTSDRAREALFNLLAHGPCARDMRGLAVADIFAGTGAVGLEALSRGAAHAVFVENDAAALRALRANIAACGMDARTNILPLDAQRLGSPPSPRDVVFLDPPYRQGLAWPVLQGLLAAEWLARDGLAVAQVAPEEEPPLDMLAASPWPLVARDDRRAGAARLVFLTRADG